MNERTYQQRTYTTRADDYDDFVAWWSQTIPALRARHGFVVESAYGSPERHELLWVVSHGGDRAAFSDAERRYAESADRTAVFSELPDWMEKIDIAFVDPILTVRSEQETR